MCHDGQGRLQANRMDGGREGTREAAAVAAAASAGCSYWLLLLAATVGCCSAHTRREGSVINND